MKKPLTNSTCAGCGKRVPRDEYHRCPGIYDEKPRASAGEWDDIAYVARSKNPDLRQEFIDALVEAGVLEKFDASPSWVTDIPEGEYGEPAYRVVQPHKHDWKISSLVYPSPTQTNDVATASCWGCGLHKPVPNRLPIEVPE